MKLLIAFLITLAFLQTTVIPVDLVIIILMLRSYVKNDQANLYIAFGIGLLVSHLSATPLGLQSLIYLLLVQIARSFANSRFSENILIFLPVTAVLLIMNTVLTAYVSNQSVSLWPKILIEVFLSLPLYYLIKAWEERFIFKKGIKLRFRK
ncbi:hypothetical protein HYS97_01135 [Candidatus Daviesbacteria bacterium]|nr:hypothetical protein [Candidatus Daviesbacteria bacterium]